MNSDVKSVSKYGRAELGSLNRCGCVTAGTPPGLGGAKEFLVTDTGLVHRWDVPDDSSFTYLF